jgi:membrane protein
VSEQTSSTEAVSEGSRVRRIQGWLSRQTDTSLGRLSMQWFRAYFRASHNSACAITVYSALSVLPAALAFIAVAYTPGGGDVNVYAQNLVDHLNLTGTTASLVKTTFGSASSNALAASVATIVGFLLWGIGIGQIYQDVYARAWGVQVGSAADQVLYTIFFFVFAGAIALSTIGQAELGDTGRWAILPVWFAGSLVFWLGVPHVLLHRKVGLRALLPGALLATVVLGGTAAVSPLFLPATLAANGKAFSSLGIVLTVVGYMFTMITISLACAVFAPVWAEWRSGERAMASPPASRSS